MFASNTCIIPCLRYRETEAALDWLCAVFGFTADKLRAGPDGDLEQARLRLGSGSVLLAPLAGADECEHPWPMPQTEERPDAQRCNLLLVVDDPEALYRRAQQAGTHMLQPLDEDGQGFVCRDPEGHVWSFSRALPW